MQRSGPRQPGAGVHRLHPALRGVDQTDEGRRRNSEPSCFRRLRRQTRSASRPKTGRSEPLRSRPGEIHQVPGPHVRVRQGYKGPPEGLTQRSCILPTVSSRGNSPASLMRAPSGESFLLSPSKVPQGSAFPGRHLSSENDQVALCLYSAGTPFASPTPPTCPPPAPPSQTPPSTNT